MRPKSQKQVTVIENSRANLLKSCRVQFEVQFPRIFIMTLLLSPINFFLIHWIFFYCHTKNFTSHVVLSQKPNFFDVRNKIACTVSAHSPLEIEYQRESQTNDKLGK